MADKSNDKVKFEEIQKQIDNLKNIDGEFGAIKDKALDVNAHAGKLKDAGLSFKNKVLSSLTGTVAVAVLSILAQAFFPWWTIAVVGFGVGFWLSDTEGRSFFYGFLATFLVWSIYAAYQSLANGSLITNTISSMLGGTFSGGQLIFATGTLGGLVTGLAAVSGTLLRSLVKKEV
jgi:hypothetical protein